MKFLNLEKNLLFYNSSLEQFLSKSSTKCMLLKVKKHSSFFYTLQSSFIQASYNNNVASGKSENKRQTIYGKREP